MIRPMRIGMILAKPFPPDIRVEKESAALIQAGTAVAVLANSPQPTRTNWETTAEGLKVFRQHVPLEPFLRRNLKGLTLFERSWLPSLHQFVEEFQPDCLHVHDFLFVKTALGVAKEYKIPLIADLHEDMPAMLRESRKAYPRIKRIKDSVLRNYDVWRWYERRILPNCDRIIVVVPEAKERLIKYNINPNKIYVISNTEDDTTFHFDLIDPEIKDRYEKYWVTSYVGSLGPQRGIDTAIKAIPFVVEAIPNFKLVIVGVKGKREENELSNMAEKHGVASFLDVWGWQPSQRVGSFIMISSSCLVPHHDNEHTRTTVPHKLFQYMLMGKPTIVSDVAPLRRIADDTKAALVFHAGDPKSLANCLIHLHKNPKLALELGLNGQAAAQGPYSWRIDAKKLVQLYKDLGNQIRI